MMSGQASAYTSPDDAETSVDLGFDSYELNRKRVYILPTRHGIAFLIALIVMLLGSINYNNNLGFMLTFLLGSLGLVAILHTYKNVAGIVLSLSPGRAVFAGEDAQFRLTLDNRDGEERIQIAVSYRLDKNRAFVVCTDIAKNASADVRISLPTTTRGETRLPRLTVASRFPLGLLRAWAYFDSTTTTLVYPQPRGQLALPMRQSNDGNGAQPKGHGNDDFSGLRDYVPGDSSRRIHWKNEARGERTSVKQFSGASPLQVEFGWANVPGEDIETKLSQLTLWILQAQSQGLAYTLHMPNASLSPALGNDQHGICLRELALYGLTDA